MKKLFTILFISLFIFSCSSLLSTCLEGDCNNGQGTLKYSGHTYVGEFKDGKRHGKGILTSSNGKVYEGEFNENRESKFDIGFLINGTITRYYEDDNDVKSIYNIVDGDVETFKTFDESGNLDMESISIDSLNSKIINYYKNGNIQVSSHYKRLNTKILRQESTLGEYILFYKNENIYLEGYKDSSGMNQINSWDKEGKQTLINGNGFYSTYYKESEILESKGPVKNGKLDQLWIYYNEDGSITKEEIYKDGKLTKTKEY